MLIDLDDTIIDGRSGVHPCWREVCGKAAHQVPRLDANDLYVTICRVRDWYWSDPERHRRGRADLPAARAEIVQRAMLSFGFDLPDLALKWAGPTKNCEMSERL